MIFCWLFCMQIQLYLSTYACLEVMFEFEWRATYFVLSRAKPILASLGMPKWVWFSMKWHSIFFVCTSTLPPSMYPNLTEYGRYCMLTPNSWSNSHVELEDNSKQPNSITLLKWTPIFEWWVGRCGSKNGHQKDMCSKGIGIWSQNCQPL